MMKRATSVNVARDANRQIIWRVILFTIKSEFAARGARDKVYLIAHLELKQCFTAIAIFLETP
jgi:hypothetical protein